MDSGRVAHRYAQATVGAPRAVLPVVMNASTQRTPGGLGPDASQPLDAPRTPRTPPRAMRMTRKAGSGMDAALVQGVILPSDGVSTHDVASFASYGPEHPRTRKTTFRTGARAPQKSSLPVVVVIGLVVGLFAFVVMSLCLPHASARPSALATLPPPVAAPAPAVVAPAIVALAPAPIATPVAAAPAVVKSVHRRASKTKARSSAPLPSNPYKTDPQIFN